MSRGTTLGVMVDMLRSEIRDSNNPALGINARASYVNYLQRMQEDLYDDFDWPFLRFAFDKRLQAGERYYDIPTGIVLEGIQAVRLKWGGIWSGNLDRGITPEDYSAYDSERDVRVDPVQKWDLFGDRQFEVWPVPASNSDAVSNNLLRFTGKEALPSLINDADRAVLDDRLIVLSVAAEILAARKAPDAQAKLQIANRRFKRLTGLSRRTKPFVLGGSSTPNARRYPPVVVAYAR